MTDGPAQNDTMPPFRLPASTGQTLGSDAWIGKTPLVIFFLPGVESEADIAQIHEYDGLLREFGSERSQVLGVVKETARRLRALSDERGLNLPLLADAGGEMITAFGVDGPDGRARRVTFVIDKEGTIVRRFDPAPPDDQAITMLNAVKELRDGRITSGQGNTEPPG